MRTVDLSQVVVEQAIFGNFNFSIGDGMAHATQSSHEILRHRLALHGFADGISTEQSVALVLVDECFEAMAIVCLE